MSTPAVTRSAEYTAQAPPVYAGLGLFSTVLGTLLGVLLLPERDATQAALVFPAAMLCTGLAIAPFAASLRDPKAILRLEHLLPFAVVYWLLLDLLQGDAVLLGLTSADVANGFIAVGTFCAGCYGAALFARWHVPGLVQRSVDRDVPPALIFKLAVLCFAVGSFKYFYAVGFNPSKFIFFLGVGRWAAPWGPQTLGGWDAILDHLPYFGFLVPVFGVTLGLRIGWLRGPTILVFLMAVLLLLLLAQGGGRRVVGVMAGAPLITWILAQQRLDVRKLIVIGVAVASILYFMEVMLRYRNIGLAHYFYGDAAEEVAFDRVNVDDNFFRLCQIIKIIPDSHDYVYHQQLVYALVRPIPRAIWQGKPVGSGFNLAEFIGEKGLSLSVSVISEWYMSGGYIIVLIGGLIYGQLARMVSALWAVTHLGVGRLLYAVCAMTLFAGVRSMTELVLMSYIVLAWLAIWWLFLRNRTDKD